jgi:biotin transport system substrate-specific component
LISVFAALTAIGAFIKVPTPIVPFTLQFLFCTYAGLLLGAKHGLYSQLLYLFIGLIGIPIFANGGGPTYVLQPTFGYLIGFAVCSYIVGKIVDRSAEIKFWPIFGVILIGLMLIYLLGVGYLYMMVNFYLHKEMTVMTALMVGFIPYITFDVLQSVVIALTAVRIVPILRRSGYLKTQFVK